ncbi:MAG TPA: hypothetical protein VGB85_12195 [Nannocystis sp.]|jgi:hypothetical protein
MIDVPPLSAAHKQLLFEEYQRRMRSCVPWSPAMPYTPEMNIIGDTYHTLNVFPELAPSDAPVPQLNPAEHADSPNKQFRYCIRLHRAGHQLMTWFGDRTGSVIFDSDVHIPAIYQCLPGQPGVWNETPWMSLTPAEILTLREGSRMARGRVVIAGLGLGHQLIEVSKRLQVKEILLVELSQELVDFYLPRVRPLVKKRLTVLVGDAYQIVPTLTADVALIDIFPAYGGNEAATRELARRSPKIKKMWGWGTATLRR